MTTVRCSLAGRSTQQRKGLIAARGATFRRGRLRTHLHHRGPGDARRGLGGEGAFVRLGLAEALLGELGQALTEFESMVNAFNAGRRKHIGARAELEAVMRDIGEVVRVLDGLNRYRFGADPNLMAVWNAAREVFGPFKPKPAGETPSDGATPHSGDIAPVA